MCRSRLNTVTSVCVGVGIKVKPRSKICLWAAVSRNVEHKFITLDKRGSASSPSTPLNSLTLKASFQKYGELYPPSSGQDHDDLAGTAAGQSQASNQFFPLQARSENGRQPCVVIDTGEPNSGHWKLGGGYPQQAKKVFTDRSLCIRFHAV